MKVEELAFKLAEWANEFEQAIGAADTASNKLWMFLANRLAEIDLSQLDEDVVTASIMGEHRRVKIVGTHSSFLCYEDVGGRIGTGLVPMDSISSSDRGKLNDILGKLEREGRIGRR